MQENKVEKKIWFRRKLYGWGWTPSTWEGWLVLLVWVVLFVTATSNIDHELIKNVTFMVLSTTVLILICYKKGEKPRWQWGNGGKRNNEKIIGKEDTK